jgi:hypothetical protein
MTHPDLPPVGPAAPLPEPASLPGSGAAAALEVTMTDPIDHNTERRAAALEAALAAAERRAEAEKAEADRYCAALDAMIRKHEAAEALAAGLRRERDEALQRVEVAESVAACVATDRDDATSDADRIAAEAAALRAERDALRAGLDAERRAYHNVRDERDALREALSDVLRKLRGDDDETLPDRVEEAYAIAYAAYYRAPAPRAALTIPKGRDWWMDKARREVGAVKAGAPLDPGPFVPPCQNGHDVPTAGCEMCAPWLAAPRAEATTSAEPVRCTRCGGALSGTAVATFDRRILCASCAAAEGRQTAGGEGPRAEATKEERDA